MKKRIEKRNKGITLIALVITIIVLLILAGISIATLSGKNGILTQTEEAKTQHKIGEEKEAIGIAYAATKSKKIVNSDKNKITAKELKDQLHEDGVIMTTTKYNNSHNIIVTYTDSQREYEVKQTGEIVEKTEDESYEPDDSSYKDLTEEERFEKMDEITEQAKIFTDANSYDEANHFNTIGKYAETNGIGTKIQCECGKAKEIFEKAEELGLVKNYYVGTNQNKNIPAPITEPSLAYFEFALNNKDNKDTEELNFMFRNMRVRVANILNRNIKEEWLKEWINVSYPAYGDQYGDYETCLMWLGEEFADVGFVMGAVDSVKRPNYTLEELDIKATMGWKILPQIGFLQVAQELGIDFSGYNCEHATK